jgi:hypothetical protein
MERRRAQESEPEKLEIAAWLRRETTLSIKENARRVYLGTSKGANAHLHKHLRAQPPSGLGQPQLGTSAKESI